MEADKNNPDELNIRCPSCRLRFNVPPQLMNRLVECGGCDSQFRITDDIVIHSKKRYPGEKKEAETNQFRRIPLDNLSAPKGMQTINYAEFNHPEQLGPASPQRVIAGIFGVVIMVMGALLLLISLKPTSPLGGISFEKKLIISSFSSFLGFVFLVYANPGARIKAGFVGLLLAAGVFAIPIFMKEPVSEIGKNPKSLEELIPNRAAKNNIDPITELKQRFVTQPLENEINRLAASSSDKKAYGIFITEMLGRNKTTARDYLIRETRAGISSHPYPRSGDNYLMVLTEVGMSIEEVERIVSKLGKVTEVHPEINVIVVKVDNEQFVAGSSEKISDPTHPTFYQANLRELQSIDLGRIEQAVERLANSDASILRGDISQVLIELLNKPGVTFHNSIARALLKWSEDPSRAAEAGLVTLKAYAKEKVSPPEHLVRLVCDNKKSEAIPVMASIWETNTVLWDKEMVKFGPPIEPFVLESLKSDQLPLRRAAIKMLGDVGTDASLPALKNALKEQDPEIRLLAERSIQQIEQR